MDGHFVPNLTIGPPVVKALKTVATKPLDVHLMIDNADDTIDWYLDAGADIVTVHVEASPHLHRDAARASAKRGATAGCLAQSRRRRSTALAEVLGVVDLVLVMSVNPGFGGQTFIERSVEKVGELAGMCRAAGRQPDHPGRRRHQRRDRRRSCAAAGARVPRRRQRRLRRRGSRCGDRRDPRRRAGSDRLSAASAGVSRASRLDASVRSRSCAILQHAFFRAG